MKPVLVSENIVPLGEFKSQASRFLKQLASQHHPLVITQNGRPAGVLLSPAEFDRLQETQQFLQSVAAGIADAEAGRVMSTTELRERLADRRSQETSE